MVPPRLTRFFISNKENGQRLSNQNKTPQKPQVNALIPDPFGVQDPLGADLCVSQDSVRRDLNVQIRPKAGTTQNDLPLLQVNMSLVFKSI